MIVKQIPADETERAERTRRRILQAAVQHFSQHGLAGARTDSIAQTAKVNKALLYYYFKSKTGLYAAALQYVASQISENSIAALESGATAGESLLRFSLNHFDRISSQHESQSLMQQEMVRFRRGESEVIPVLVRSLFAPLLKKMQAVIREGIRSGELCDFDWLQVIYSSLGANVFYFLSAPMLRMALSLETADRLSPEIRRKAALEMLGQALFQDRGHGLKLAQSVLASSPAPKHKGLPIRRFL